MAAKKNTPTAYAGNEPYIFVSYAHKDSDKAFPFIAALQKKGYNVWFDAGVIPGYEWPDYIGDKVLGCSLFVFLVSKLSLESKNCKDELHFAREEEKKFVNVMIEDIPDKDYPSWFKLRFKRYQSFPAFSCGSYDEVVEALKMVPEMSATRSSVGTDEEKKTTGTAKTDNVFVPRATDEDAKSTLAKPVLRKADFQQGSFVEFGSYPQGPNGETAPIEWLVLENDGQKALLISRYALDAREYNETRIGMTWETSSLRNWLNRIFVNEAFAADEQNLIRRTTVTADRNPSYSTSPGNDTTDKVFLLSITEVNKYFSSHDERKCAPTDYAKAQGASAHDSYLVDGKAACQWWLRAPGFDSSHAAHVYFGGRVCDYGSIVDYPFHAVRPALWIDLGPSTKVSEMSATRSSAGVDVEKKPPETAKADTGSAIRATVETVKQTLAELKLRTADFKTGAFIEFGSYPQSADGKKSPIEWLVLENDGQKALLISRYALDARRYNETRIEVTWETCSLRNWLNRIFVNEAFATDEQNLIRRTTVTADRNPSYSTSPGNNTIDKVFLLSITEVKKYFSSYDEMKCAPTDYAKAQGTPTSDRHTRDGKATCQWWLRAPGFDSSHAAHVYFGGLVCDYGSIVDYSSHAVRPALWINLES